MCGSSLPNRIFKNLEITFNFAYIFIFFTYTYPPPI